MLELCRAVPINGSQPKYVRANIHVFKYRSLLKNILAMVNPLNPLNPLNTTGAKSGPRHHIMRLALLTLNQRTCAN
jgi:hypothetical protein